MARNYFPLTVFFISEVMLQQTQAARVIPKYLNFIATFPNFKHLADAPFKEVLIAWQGLGYNRRAQALKKSAEIIIQNYQGQLPQTTDELIALPGIGLATACSI